ncbi:hypothetical protein SNE40_016595 [Patella caerulea]|uniref:SOCS box domain-containing protein n=1 Tax=Patella caerulea TaxID=87958 RepID=A0AAN8J9J5_PATCE
MQQPRHNRKPRGRFNQKSTFILDNFNQWVKTLDKEKKCKKSKAELGQMRLALAAFINGLADLHRTSMKKSAGQSCCLRSIHDKIYIALRLCYELDLKSRNTPRKLIQEILVCEGNLYSIFSIFSLCHVTMEFPSFNINSFSLYPGLTASTFKDKVVPAFKYYCQCLIPTIDSEIYISDSIRLETFINRPIDESFITVSPLKAAAMMKDPQLVSMLLDFGADPSLRMGEDDSENSSPLGYIICYLNSYCALTKYSKFDGSIFKQALECFHFMTKVVTNIQIKENQLQWNQEDHCKNTIENIFTVHPLLASYINLDKFKQPSSLQQLSSTVIRKAIIKYSCDILHNSIEYLPIPQLLKRFLSLD